MKTTQLILLSTTDDVVSKAAKASGAWLRKIIQDAPAMAMGNLYQSAISLTEEQKHWLEDGSPTDCIILPTSVIIKAHDTAIASGLTSYLFEVDDVTCCVIGPHDNDKELLGSI